MTRIHSSGLNRRHLLTLMGGAAALGATGMKAHAQSMSGVVGTWGGDYRNLLQSNIVEPILDPKGVEILYDIANAPPRKNKLLAERRLPTGTLDVACFSDIDMYEMSLTGVLSDLDTSQIPNADNLIDALRKDYAAPHIYSGLVIVYNPDHASPTSWNDMWNSDFAGKVGFADGLYIQNLFAAAMAAGGDRSNYEPGKDKLLELKEMGARVYPSNEAVAQALNSGEIWMVPMWRARAFQWSTSGIPVTDIAPDEGVAPIVFEMAIPSNAPNPEAGYAFLDAMLAPQAQDRFAETMGYVPTVTNAPLPGELQDRLTFTEEEQANFIVPDYDYIAENNNDFREWWQREFLG